MWSLVLFCVVVVGAVEAVAQDRHHIVSKEKLLSLEKEVLQLEDIPFGTMMKLFRMSEVSPKNHTHLMDLEEAGGALVQSTQYELFVHQMTMATLLVAGGLDQEALHSRDGHAFARAMTPRFLHDGCPNCLHQRHIEQMDVALNVWPYVLLLGEALDQFFDLMHCVPKSELRPGPSHEDGNVEISVEGVVHTLLDRVAPSMRPTMQARLNDIISEIAGGDDQVSACEFVRPYLISRFDYESESAKELSLQDYTQLAQSKEASNPGLSAEIIFKMSKFASYATKGDAPAGARLKGTDVLSGCQASFATAVMHVDQSERMKWTASMFWEVSAGPLHFWTEKYGSGKVLTFTSLQMLLKAVDYGNMAFHEGIFDVSRILPLAPTDDEEQIQAARALFREIDTDGSGSLTPANIQAFLREKCLNGVASEAERQLVNVQVFKDFYGSEDDQITEDDFLLGISSFSAMVHDVTIEQIGLVVRILNGGEGGEPLQMTESETFLRFILLLFTFGQESENGMIDGATFDKWVVIILEADTFSPRKGGAPPRLQAQGPGKPKPPPVKPKQPPVVKPATKRTTPPTLPLPRPDPVSDDCDDAMIRNALVAKYDGFTMDPGRVLQDGKQRIVPCQPSTIYEGEVKVVCRSGNIQFPASDPGCTRRPCSPQFIAGALKKHLHGGIDTSQVKDIIEWDATADYDCAAFDRLTLTGTITAHCAKDPKTGRNTLIFRPTCQPVQTAPTKKQVQPPRRPEGQTVRERTDNYVPPPPSGASCTVDSIKTALLAELGALGVEAVSPEPLREITAGQHETIQCRTLDGMLSGTIRITCPQGTSKQPHFINNCMAPQCEPGQLYYGTETPERYYTHFTGERGKICSGTAVVGCQTTSVAPQTISCVKRAGKCVWDTDTVPLPGCRPIPERQRGFCTRDMVVTALINAGVPNGEVDGLMAGIKLNGRPYTFPAEGFRLPSTTRDEYLAVDCPSNMQGRTLADGKPMPPTGPIRIFCDTAEIFTTAPGGHDSQVEIDLRSGCDGLGRKARKGCSKMAVLPALHEFAPHVARSVRDEELRVGNEQTLNIPCHEWESGMITVSCRNGQARMTGISCKPKPQTHPYMKCDTSTLNELGYNIKTCGELPVNVRDACSSYSASTYCFQGGSKHYMGVHNTKTDHLLARCVPSDPAGVTGPSNPCRWEIEAKPAAKNYVREKTCVFREQMSAKATAWLDLPSGMQKVPDEKICENRG